MFARTLVAALAALTIASIQTERPEILWQFDAGG